MILHPLIKTAAGYAATALGYVNPADDPRLLPVVGDEIDEIVNIQLARGRTDRS